MEKKPEVEVELNPNAPELHCKGDNEEWAKQGFFNKEDYECHMRRMGDRKK